MATVRGWLPDPLDGLIADQLGRPVMRTRGVAGTFAADIALVATLADSTEVFVKASRAPERRGDYVTEAAIAGRLPEGLSTPRLRGWLEHDPWVALWFEAVEGTLPAQPWTPSAADAVLESHRLRAPVLTPSPVEDLRSIPAMIGDAFSAWRRLEAGHHMAVEPDLLDAWVRRHLTDLARWEERWPAAVSGDTLCHFDPRADNYLISADGRAWVIDWSRGGVGAAWVDLATYLVTLAGDGFDAERTFRAEPVAREADPDDVNSHLAALAGYWINVAHEERPGRSPALLDYQRRSGAGALTWLQARAG